MSHAITQENIKKHENFQVWLEQAIIRGKYGNKILDDYIRIIDKSDNLEQISIELATS